MAHDEVAKDVERDRGVGEGGDIKCGDTAECETLQKLVDDATLFVCGAIFVRSGLLAGVTSDERRLGARKTRENVSLGYLRRV